MFSCAILKNGLKSIHSTTLQRCCVRTKMIFSTPDNLINWFLHIFLTHPQEWKQQWFFELNQPRNSLIPTYSQLCKQGSAVSHRKNNLSFISPESQAKSLHGRKSRKYLYWISIFGFMLLTLQRLNWLEGIEMTTILIA